MLAGYSPNFLTGKPAYHITVGPKESGAGLAHAGYCFYGIDKEGNILMYKHRLPWYAGLQESDGKLDQIEFFKLKPKEEKA